MSVPPGPLLEKIWTNCISTQDSLFVEGVNILTYPYYKMAKCTTFFTIHVGFRTYHTVMLFTMVQDLKKNNEFSFPLIFTALRTRNRTKKSCTCCASPTKHTHYVKGRERRRGSRANLSSSEPVSEAESTAEGGKEADGITEIDSKTSTETDAKQTGDQQHVPDVVDEKDISEIDDDDDDQRNVFDDLQLGKSDLSGTSEAGSDGGTAFGQQNLEVGEKVEDGGESKNLEGSNEVGSVQEAADELGEVKDNVEQVNDDNNESHVAQVGQKVEVEDEKQVKSVEKPEMNTKTSENVEEPEQTLEKECVEPEQDDVELTQGREPSKQIPVSEPTEQPYMNKEIPKQSEDKTKDSSSVFAASEQIAKEHMYSQPMPIQEETNEQVKISNSEQKEGNQEQNEIKTDEIPGDTGSSEAEAPLPTDTNKQGNTEVASVDSEMADSNNASDVNVVYFRPSDINMTIDEDDDSQTGKEQIASNDQEPGNDEDEKEEDLECETFENGKRIGKPMEIEHTDTAQTSGDQPMELQMAHPDEPLGQIKISEPISLAGSGSIQQDEPLELTTGVQKQNQVEQSQSESAKHNSHRSKSSSDNPTEIKHKSKGLVAHQTTLPSGRPGPIILTMKTKKPKHKKSKKNKKHKDKDRERGDRDQELPPQRLTQPSIPMQHHQKPSDPPQRLPVDQSNIAAQQTQAVARPSQVVGRPPQAVARPPPAVGRQPPAPDRQPQQGIARQVQSPPSRSVPGSVMRSPNVVVSADGTMMHTMEPNVIVSADGTMRQMAEPIRHIEPPRAHMPPPKRGPAPGSRNHSHSSQPSPNNSPPNAQHQFYPVTMGHHPRMAGPPPGHPAHHMSPADFANMRARYPHQLYHSGLPPHVEASFAGAPQSIRGSSQHPMSNAPNPAEAAYIRAQSLARHCHPHHPHWQPNGPPHSCLGILTYIVAQFYVSHDMDTRIIKECQVTFLQGLEDPQCLVIFLLELDDLHHSYLHQGHRLKEQSTQSVFIKSVLKVHIYRQGLQRFVVTLAPKSPPEVPHLKACSQ